MRSTPTARNAGTPPSPATSVGRSLIRSIPNSSWAAPDTLDHAGFILSASAQDAHELWRVTLPMEDPTVWNPAVGIFGFNQFPNTRARFTADGQTAYVITGTATGDNNTSRSFVYSLNAGNGTPPPPSPTPTATATSTPSATATPPFPPSYNYPFPYIPPPPQRKPPPPLPPLYSHPPPLLPLPGVPFPPPGAPPPPKAEPVTKVTVTITGFNHTFPSDVDMLLVGPAGQKFILVSDVIGGTDAVNINWTLDDAAATFIPSPGTPVSGTFKPSNYIVCDDTFPGAPDGPYLSPGGATGPPCGTDTLATFAGVNPNGTWSLYIVDGASFDAGTITGGWSLNITTNGGDCTTPTPTATATPVVTPTPTPTPIPINISGTISYCSNPSLYPVPNVTLTLTGTMGSSTLSDGSGNYTFSSLPSGGNYTVTPTKTALTPGSAGINTLDVVATQRHFLNIGTLLSGCLLTAADVNGDTVINTVDVIANQRFFLGLSTGIANTGKYQFTPASRTYPGIVSNQTAQDYGTLIFGDVAGNPGERLDGPTQTAAGDDMSFAEVPASVAAVALPEVAVDQSKNNFVAAVTTSAIDTKNKLVGFQGDFTFDERVVTFQSEPVQKAGITGGNWNVSGNVLPGTGPIRTLRISAYSNDFTPLTGSGTLFELRITRVSQAAQGTPLIWAAPPDQFIL